MAMASLGGGLHTASAWNKSATMIDRRQPNSWRTPWTSSKEIALTTVQEFSQPKKSTLQAAKNTQDARRHVKNTGFVSFPVPPISYGREEASIHRLEKGHAIKRHEGSSGCPVSREFQQARAQHPVLASTGCTKEFCQAGRSVHTDEPRIGENRSIEVVEKEAEGFLRELQQEHFFDTNEAFEKRLRDVLVEIRAGACQGVIREGHREGIIGGNWLQTSAELEFGIRRSWRNARKCIMRSHCEELKLCDLRNATSSAEMANQLVRHMCEAFNGGNVLPTVFMFPPRKINSRGPMIWNHQVLEFAGYRLEDGSILGDPMSAALTDAIVELGWKPPSPRSRWDLLPLVVMADNDAPIMIEIPPPLCNLVKIRHPLYDTEFEKLDLRWVAAPALTRLGFDIGGVQYTAAPFIGWFMDAEIGVRDLADIFRYNALPDVAKALGLHDGKAEDGIESLEDFPEYERLSILTRAQTELTYAAYWSYQEAKVSMSDTLTASMKWCRYDDDFKAKNGFRLPADPYWLAPPQGSIVPVWHRGGAPCYQPKPMITKHVQDPLKAWSRERPNGFATAKMLRIATSIQPKRPPMQSRHSTSDCFSGTCNQSHLQNNTTLALQQQTSKSNTAEQRALQDGIQDDENRLFVSVYFCSAGTFAEKLATKLHGRLNDLAKIFPNFSLCPKIKPLNDLEVSAMKSGSIILAVVSSTGQGEVPKNGIEFVKMCEEKPIQRLGSQIANFRYAIYGNGDSRYSATYNGAATSVEEKLLHVGGLPLLGSLYQGDTALHATALQALTPWWAKLRPVMQDLATNSPKIRRIHSDEVLEKEHIFEPTSGHAKSKLHIRLRNKELLNGFNEAAVVTVTPSFHDAYQGTYLVSLDVKSKSWEDLDCIQILPTNSPAKVRRGLQALGINASEKVFLEVPEADNLVFSAFLTSYVDLEAPFQHFEWLDSLSSDRLSTISEEKLRPLTSLDALEYLHISGILQGEIALAHSICLALPPLHPKTYSIASSQSYTPSPAVCNMKPRPPTPSQQHLEILAKPLPQGRFSNKFLSSSTSTSLHYRFLASSASSLLNLHPNTPLIIIATGAGFAPVRCLLQRRIAASRTSTSDHQSSIALFLGLKPADVPLFSGILNEAAAAGLMESMSLVSSNEGKVRVYDRFLEEGTREKIRRLIVDSGAWVFLCTNPEAAEGTRKVFEQVLGEGGVDVMGERWVEEVF